MRRGVRLGRLNFELVGQGPLASAVLDELPAQMANADQVPDVIFEFGRIRMPKDAAVHLGQYVVGKGWIFVNDKYLPHLIVRNDSYLHVTVEWRIGILGSRLAQYAIRPLDYAFNDAWHRLSKRFYYLIFNQIVQIQQLGKGQTFCHASACTDGRRTLLLMAWGGIGKTSSLIQLLHSAESWRFISDDLAVLDDTGVVHRTPLKMQVYPYNLEGEGRLGRQLMRGRSLIDRSQWSLRQWVLGKKSVRRRVHAELLFGEGKGVASAPLTHALFLRRANVEEFSARQVTPSDVSSQMAHVMQFELQALWSLLAATGSVGPQSEGFGLGLDSPMATRLVNDIVEAGLRRAAASPILLDVPLHATPADLLAAVTGQIGQF